VETHSFMERWEMVVNCGEIEGFCVGNSPYPFLQREYVG